MEAEHLLRIDGLAKQYGSFTLGPVDLAIPRGSLFGLIGPNGAGKTTLLHCLLGLAQPRAGEAVLNGLHFKRDEAAFKGQVGFAGPVLNWRTWGRIGRVMDFLRPFYPAWDDRYAIQLLGRFNLSLDDKIATLSSGAQTKLALVLAMAHRPALLILDEPTMGLDAAARRVLFEELLSVVESGERSALVSSHDLGDLERYTDRVGILHRGRLLAEGAPAELCERHAQLTLNLPDTWRAPRGARITRRSPGRVQLLIELEHAGALAAAGIPVSDAVPVNLEDLFLALTTGARTEEQA